MDKDVCKNKFYSSVMELLREFPEEFNCFDELWKTNDYRLAYLILEKIISTNKIQLTDYYRIIDEEFYWLFIE